MKTSLYNFTAEVLLLPLPLCGSSWGRGGLRRELGLGAGRFCSEFECGGGCPSFPCVECRLFKLWEMYL